MVVASRSLLILLAVLCAWTAAARAAGPSANFQADPRLGEAPLVVHFHNTSSGEGPLAFHWDFDDGQQSTERDPSHTFSLPDIYKVTLTVSDGVNPPDKHSVAITVDGPTLVAAVLPGSRSVMVGTTATAFVSVVNAGHITATGVKIQLDNATGPGGLPLPATFTYQRTDSATNAPIGSPNEPVDISPGGSRSFVVAITPTAAFSPIDVRFDIDGTNTTRDARTVVGLNTLLLSASPTPTPDVIAVALTPDANGILTVAGSSAFVVATANVGAEGPITASVDTNGVALPLALSICRTDPGSGQCVSAGGSSVSLNVDAGATQTFAVFATADGAVPYDPETRRIFVRFTDAGGAVRGATSVAVKTP